MRIPLWYSLIKNISMKHSKANLLFLGLLCTLLLFSSCSDDDADITTPITLGSNVTVTNTFQSTAFTMDAELAVEDLFMQPAGSLAASATVGEGVEFSAYLLSLYDINISENSIRFEVVAQEGDPTYGDLFRVLEPNTFDRYYFTFDSAQDVNGFTSSNASVGLRIDSDNVIVVEIGSGYDFKPGQNFTITLN